MKNTMTQVLVSASLATGAVAGVTATAADCSSDSGAATRMVTAEYAFAALAQTSIKTAFLTYLAPDALILQPNPIPGVRFYEGLKESKDTLTWYPTAGGLAGSADLGFTTGPWIYTPAGSGQPSQGDFITVWQLAADCQWHVAFDGGVEHGAPPVAAGKLTPGDAGSIHTAAPASAAASAPASAAAAAEAARAVTEFQTTAQRDGFAAALRTYARNDGFRYLTDAALPLVGPGAASRYLAAHPIKLAAWREAQRGHSRDWTLLYAVGELVNTKQQSTAAYLQIWQFDSKIATWALRLLLVSPLPLQEG